MIKTHEINLNTSIYNALRNANSAIIQDDVNKKIGQNDYVLFKQIETIDGQSEETGLYMFVKIKNVISEHPGLNDGYILIIYDEIN